MAALWRRPMMWPRRFLSLPLQSAAIDDLLDVNEAHLHRGRLGHRATLGVGARLQEPIAARHGNVLLKSSSLPPAGCPRTLLPPFLSQDGRVRDGNLLRHRARLSRSNALPQKHIPPPAGILNPLHPPFLGSGGGSGGGRVLA